MTAVIGGKEYVIGGWSNYEIKRRKAARYFGGNESQDSAEIDKSQYGNRTYITTVDAIESLENNIKSVKILKHAFRKTGEAISRLETLICEDPFNNCEMDNIFIDMPISSRDFYDFDKYNDIQAIYNITQAAISLSNQLGTVIADLPATENVDIIESIAYNISDINKLEKSLLPYLKNKEDIYITVANRLSDITDVINKKIEKIENKDGS